MRSRQIERSLRLANALVSKQYVCNACRAQAVRLLSTSTTRAAEQSLFKRLRDGIFGSEESRAATKIREEKQQKRTQEQLDRGGTPEQEQLEVKTSRDGKQYQVARAVDPTLDKRYVPAKSWDGLERVGSEAWVKARADKGEQYVGFIPAKRTALDDRQWQMLLHHVAVEVFALSNAGRPPGQVCFPRLADSNSWVHTRGAVIEPLQGSGGSNIVFTSASAEETVLRSIPESLPDSLTPNEQLLSNEVESAVADAGESKKKPGEKSPDAVIPASWNDISIQHPQIKLAIFKRILQLTGKRIPDSALSRSHTLAELYGHLRAKEKPAKLYQTEEMQRLQVQVPNISVHGRRQTLIDKEKKIGRWKIIVDELERRGLPVTGSNWVDAKVTYRH